MSQRLVMDERRILIFFSEERLGDSFRMNAELVLSNCVTHSELVLSDD